MSREERKTMIERGNPKLSIEPAMSPADDQPLLILLYAPSWC